MYKYACSKVRKMEEIRKYCAFISYRHKELDKNIAKQIHSKIERYTVPKEMREKWGSKKLGKVFRDEEELPVSSNLSESICLALDNTDYLIVICTPDTPESLWVEREITYFLEHHDRDHVVAVLAKGTPETSFPKPLTSITDENGNEIGTIEPLAANLTGVDHEHSTSRLKKEVVRLYAAIMGCPFDSLWQREKRQRLHRMLALVSILAAVAIIYGITLIVKDQKIQEQYEEIKKNAEQIEDQKNQIEFRMRQIEEQKNKIEAQRDEIATNRDEIAENRDMIADQRRDLAIKMSESSLSEAELQLANGEIKKAIKSTLNAISTEEGMETYADRAEYLLSKALGAEQYDNKMRIVSTIEQETEVDELLLSKDGEKLYTLDAHGYVRCFMIESGKLLWKGNAHISTLLGVTSRQRLIELEKYGILLCLGKERVTAFSLEDGSITWDRELGTVLAGDFHVLSKDKEKLAVMMGPDNEMPWNEVGKIVIINTKDGMIEKEVMLTDALEDNHIIGYGNCLGVFSEDEKNLYGMSYYSFGTSAYGSIFFKVDLEEETIEILSTRHLSDPSEAYLLEGRYPFVIGMTYDSDNEKVIFAHYDAWDQLVMTEEYSEKDGAFSVIGETQLSVPWRESYRVYQSTFTREENLMLYSVESVAFAYDLSKGMITREYKGSDAKVLKITRLNSEHSGISILMDDGYQHYLYAKGGGYAVSDFLARSMIRLMDITPGFVTNNDGSNTLTLSDSAVGAILVDIGINSSDNIIYILKPDKDNSYKTMDWFEAPGNEEGVSYNLKLEVFGEGKLALWDAKGRDGVVKIIDATTGKTEAEYILLPENESDYSTSFLMNYSTIWDDGKHFTLTPTGSDIWIYNLETGTHEKAFEESGKMVLAKAASTTKLAEGRALQAIVCKKENTSVFDAEYEIRYRVGNDEIKTLENQTGRSLCTEGPYVDRSYLNTSGYGLILGLLSSDKKMVDGYYIYDINSDSSIVIDLENFCTPENISIIMADSKPMFMTLIDDEEKDRLSIKIYDAISGKVIREISSKTKREDIVSTFFLNDDNDIAIWTIDRSLSVYDIETGGALIEDKIGMFERYLKNGKARLKLDKIEDRERNRIFLYITDSVAPGVEAIILNTETWEKQADFSGFSTFCPKTNEIYKIKNRYMEFKDEKDAIISVKAYTLDDLIEKAKKY